MPNFLPKSEPDHIQNWIHLYSPDVFNCFSGVNPEGEIILMSCKVGEPRPNNEDNIAKRISDLARRTVVAPDEDNYPDRVKITKLEPLEVYHKNEQNLYQCLFENPHNIYKKFKNK